MKLLLHCLQILYLPLVVSFIRYIKSRHNNYFIFDKLDFKKPLDTMNSLHQYRNIYGQQKLNTTVSIDFLQDPNVYLGISYITLSSIASGITLLPLKFINIGDGFLYQLAVATGMWSSSLVVESIKGFSQFYALPMLGGFFWSVSILTTSFMVEKLGIGLSSFISNSVCLIVGWANARFGC